MFANFLAGLGLLVCLLWLVHGWLPPARQQRLNVLLRRCQQWLRHLPTDLRGRQGGRQARAQARAVIDRVRRDTAAGPGQVHDLEHYRRQREEQQRKH
jgi:hypothetical protein